MATADTRAGLDPRLANEAFKRVFSDPENRPLLERVHDAFEHRRQFPHLPESRRGGLTVVISNELATFAFPPDRIAEDHEGRPLTRSFRTRLRTAGAGIAANRIYTAGYAKLVKHQGRDVSSLTIEEVSADIIQALTNYSSDPHSKTDVGFW